MKFGTAIPLGEGAMGRVLRVFDEDLGFEVALKVLRSDDEEAARRFVREARSQARVSHPNVARVYSTGEASGRPYIAMQLLTGLPLEQL